MIYKTPQNHVLISYILRINFLRINFLHFLSQRKNANLHYNEFFFNKGWNDIYCSFNVWYRISKCITLLQGWSNAETKDPNVNGSRMTDSTFETMDTRCVTSCRISRKHFFFFFFFEYTFSACIIYNRFR